MVSESLKVSMPSRSKFRSEDDGASSDASVDFRKQNANTRTRTKSREPSVFNSRRSQSRSKSANETDSSGADSGLIMIRNGLRYWRNDEKTARHASPPPSYAGSSAENSDTTFETAAEDISEEEEHSSEDGRGRQRSRSPSQTRSLSNYSVSPSATSKGHRTPSASPSQREENESVATLRDKIMNRPRPLRHKHPKSTSESSGEESERSINWRRKIKYTDGELPYPPDLPKLRHGGSTSHSGYPSSHSGADGEINLRGILKRSPKSGTPSISSSSDSGGSRMRHKKATLALHSSDESSASSSMLSASDDDTSSKIDHRYSTGRAKKSPRPSVYGSDGSSGRGTRISHGSGWRSGPLCVAGHSSSSSSDTEGEGRPFIKATSRTANPNVASDILSHNPRPSRTSGRKSGGRTSNRSPSSSSSTRSSSSRPSGTSIHLLYERYNPSETAQPSDRYVPLSTREILGMTITQLDNACNRLCEESYHEDKRSSDFKFHAISTLLDWLKAADLVENALEKRKVFQDDSMREFFNEARKVNVKWLKDARAGESDNQLITKYKHQVNHLVSLRFTAYMPDHQEGISCDLADERHAFGEFLWTWNCVARYADAERLLKSSEDLFPRGRTMRGIKEEIYHERTSADMKLSASRRGAHRNRDSREH